MTLATVTDYNESANPSEEVVQLTVTDEYTYVSRKFKVVKAIQICKNTDDDAHINATFTGQTVTINYDSASSDKVSLTIYGGSGP